MLLTAPILHTFYVNIREVARKRSWAPLKCIEKIKNINNNLASMSIPLTHGEPLDFGLNK